MLGGVTMNMITPIELIQKVIGHMTGQRFGRILNITSISVKTPISGLDLSSGAPPG
jgi:3-oxoacyl-[acyl-carrier protein] reductase